MRRPVAARLITTAVVAAFGIAGCGTNGANNDPLQVTDTLVAAEPAKSPPASPDPAGPVLPAPPAQHTAYDAATRTLGVASGSTLLLFDTHSGGPPREVPLPSPPAQLRQHTPGQLMLAMPDANQIATVDVATAALHPTPVEGGPIDAAPVDGDLAVALRDTRSVTFLGSHRSTGGFDEPSQLLPAGPDVFVLDRLSTSVTPINIATGEKGAGLRAGQGAGEAVTDRYGRLLVTGTRVGELMAFSSNPLIMKQRYPVPGAPYGIAYDPNRDLAWVTVTETNEVVGYDVAGGEPQERHRFRTVGQPNSVAVDPGSGEVFVSSATGGGVQVVKA